MTDEWLNAVRQLAADAGGDADSSIDWRQEYADSVSILLHDIDSLRVLLRDCRNFVFRSYLQGALGHGCEIDASAFVHNDPEASHADALAVLRRLEKDIEERKDAAFELWTRAAELVGGPLEEKGI